MLTFKTEAPAALLKKFNDAIAGNGSGKEIDTWVKVTTGAHKGKFTHTSPRQKEKAYFDAVVGSGRLDFKISWPDNKWPSDGDYMYAYYHGHLSETFLHHFRESFSTLTATAKPYVAPKAAGTTPAKSA
jgi:hypothetical protein